MADALYVATGACAGCPYRQHCHEARQRAVDRIGIGRHTTCTYYREFVHRGAPRQEVPLSPIGRVLDGASRMLRRAADRLGRHAR